MLRVGDRFNFKGKGYMVLSVHEKAYEYYIKNVKNRESISRGKTNIKFTMHQILGEKLETKGNTTRYRYGNLEFYVRDNLVTWIENHKGECIHKLNINIEDKKELSKILHENYTTFERIKINVSRLLKLNKQNIKIGA